MTSRKYVCSCHDVLQSLKHLGKIKDKPQQDLVATGEENIQPAGIINVNSSILVSSPIAALGTTTESD